MELSQIGKGKRAMERLPVATHSVNGPHMIEYSGASMGEKELACEHMEKARGLSGSGLLTYGQLKLLPQWDPLRGDPRFEKIVASLAPKS
ncbi:MAG: hypothetical protein DMF27_06950 [Verrucomicrobia bacterium]|nr:MAG: hypothetical protein DMF27_06950 [Verrucomicrobiota bacterium]